jgi:hypothetical protein
MPGSLHESLGSYITQEILRQLGTIAQSSDPSAKFAGNIENSASAEINFEDTEYGSHQPDASFQHFEAQYPGVILELSYSQKKQDLSRLANEYILGSDADIRVVIGIDIEYKGSKKASISVWRPRIGVNNQGEEELFVVHTVKDRVCSPIDLLKSDILSNATSSSVMMWEILLPMLKQACNCNSRTSVQKLLVPNSQI